MYSQIMVQSKGDLREWSTQSGQYAQHCIQKEPEFEHVIQALKDFAGFYLWNESIKFTQNQTLRILTLQKVIKRRPVCRGVQLSSRRSSTVFSNLVPPFRCVEAET